MPASGAAAEGSLGSRCLRWPAATRQPAKPRSDLQIPNAAEPQSPVARADTATTPHPQSVSDNDDQAATAREI